MKKCVVLNEEIIKSIADIVSRIEINEVHEKRPLIHLKCEAEKAAVAYLMMAAICHQTHNLKCLDRNLIGWNYLEEVFIELANTRSKLLDIHYLAGCEINHLADQLEKLFPLYSGEDITSLDRALERAELIIKSCISIIESGANSVMSYLNPSEGLLHNQGRGLYELMEKLEAYKDPFKKKSTLFIKLLVQARLVEVADPENYVPLMDYHMQRLLLRTGCVVVEDEVLKDKLINRETLHTDIEIRRSCIEAIKIVTELSGKSIFDLDDIFWSIGRSCCKEKRLCQDGECNITPCTFTQISTIKEHHRCVFESSCKGRLDIALGNIWEPQVTTSYY